MHSGATTRCTNSCGASQPISPTLRLLLFHAFISLERSIYRSPCRSTGGFLQSMSISSSWAVGTEGWKRGLQTDRFNLILVSPFIQLDGLEQRCIISYENISLLSPASTEYGTVCMYCPCSGTVFHTAISMKHES